MFNLIRKINKSQLIDESFKTDYGFNNDEAAWYKDKRMKEKIQQVIERQKQNKAAPKANPGKFQKGNKYEIKPAKRNANKKIKGPKKQVGGQLGVKRKGRLPSKTIINRVGKKQTVY